MKKTINFANCLLLTAVLFLSISCKDYITGDKPELPESLDPVEEVSLVTGAESTTITVNKNKQQQAYFDIAFSDIKLNDVITNGTKDGWCIDVWKPINHNGGTYNGIALYSTYRVEKWKPLNYLLNIKEELLNGDPELTWREIQLAIWSLRANPEFDLDEVDIKKLPGDFHTNGEPKFSHEKVKEILAIVESEYKKFDFSEGTKFAVVVETPVDMQTLIAVVD